MSRLRLAVLLWVSGMIGAVAIAATVIPQLSRHITLPAPLWVITLASIAQSGVLIALTVWVGVLLTPKVGLRAPAFEAAVTARPVLSALQPQLLPGFIGGVVGGILLSAVSRFAPAALAELQQRFNLPLVARILYGGITEEILLRWGIMTLLAWLAWRVVQHGVGAPRGAYLWLAIVLSALLFGVGHLPAAYALVGKLSTDIVVFVVGANTAFGVLFGYLFWRYGLEAAMIAHGTAHAVSYIIGLS